MSDISEEVVEQITEAAPEFIQAVSGIKTGYAVLGSILTACGGAAVGYFFAMRRLETKYEEMANNEIAVMREHYVLKAKANETQAQKGALSALVEAKGYKPAAEVSEGPPMAIQPPASVVENAEETPKSPPVEVTKNVFEEAQSDHEWDFKKEKLRRDPLFPYVIHYDERYEFEDFDDTTLTYYEGDDTLCNDRDEIIDPTDRDALIGEKNLERFGHGSNDASIVYIRNDSKEMVYEVVRSPNTYAEEVQGFTHSEAWRGNLERMRRRERDEFQE